MGEAELLKTLLGLGTSGVLLVVGYFGARWLGAFLDKVKATLDEKDRLFASALKENAADIKVAVNDLKMTVEETRKTLADMDRSHTANQRETFNQLIQLNDKQNVAISTMVQKVEHLDETVERMNETLVEHSTKIDAMARSLPHPHPPGPPPGGDFRAPARP